MKRILLLILFVVISGVTLSLSAQNPSDNEELIVLTKAKHDALRKDIEDYKIMLIKYQSLKIEYETTLSDLDRLTKTTNKTFDLLQKANARVDFMEKENDALRIKVAGLEQDKIDLKLDYNQLKKMYYKEHSIAISFRKQQGNVWMWKGLALFSFASIFIVDANN